MTETDTTQRTILIVEDDPALRRLLQFGLRNEGYRVLIANQGTEGQAILTQESVDLVLMDLMMPILDGQRFLIWLRQEVELTLPAIVFTSVDSPEVLREIRELGATEVLSKPSQLPEIVRRVKQHLPK